MVLFLIWYRHFLLKNAGLNLVLYQVKQPIVWQSFTVQFDKIGWWLFLRSISQCKSNFCIPHTQVICLWGKFLPESWCVYQHSMTNLLIRRQNDVCIICIYTCIAPRCHTILPVSVGRMIFFFTIKIYLYI